MNKSNNETRLGAYAFWHCAEPATVLDALAWRRERHEHARLFAYIAGTAQSLTVGTASLSTLGQLPYSYRRYSAPEATPSVIAAFADPCAAELVAYIRALWGAHRIHGSWYRREPVQPWLDLVLARPAPQYPPEVRAFEPEDRWRDPSNSYQRRLQRAEAVATYRQMLHGAPTSQQALAEPTDPVPNPEALVGYGSGLGPDALGSSTPVPSIPTAPHPACSWCGAAHEGGPEKCADSAL